MSLKSFHIFFIVMAVLTSLGFCAWAFTLGETTSTNGLRVMGLGSGFLGLALAGYGVWFVVKKSGRLIV